MRYEDINVQVTEVPDMILGRAGFAVSGERNTQVILLYQAMFKVMIFKLAVNLGHLFPKC
jgi:hypothetical protein